MKLLSIEIAYSLRIGNGCSAKSKHWELRIGNWELGIVIRHDARGLATATL
jgi:hypothetical protein